MGQCWNGFGLGGWGGMGMVGPLLSLVLFVGILAVLAVGAIWVIRQLGRQSRRSEARVDPMEIARRRLAAGEVTVTEFEEIRGRLQR